MKTAVVVPSNRPERVRIFVKAWASQFDKPDVRLIVVEDGPNYAADLPEWVEHCCWKDIDRTLDDKASCIPRRSGGVRDFGFYLAGQDESIDMIVSLDDDVLPVEGVDFLAAHWHVLNTPRHLRWFPVIDSPRLRGFPYESSPTALPMLNHGLWYGFPDVDAITQMGDPQCEMKLAQTMEQGIRSQLVPAGQYLTVCGMNVAFRREAAPYYYFPKLPEGLKRWDDIWAGLVFKRLADIYSWAVTSGPPFLRHDRASDPLNNLRQEYLGYGANEEMWKVIDNVPESKTAAKTYLHIAREIGERFPVLLEAANQMKVWASLWGQKEEATVSRTFYQMIPVVEGKPV